MTTGDIIIHIFYLVATSLPEIPRHSQAKLYPSELVTIGILFALKGGASEHSIVGSNGIMVIGLEMALYQSVLDFNVCLRPMKIGVTCCCPIQPSLR